MWNLILVIINFSNLGVNEGLTFTFESEQECHATLRTLSATPDLQKQLVFSCRKVSGESSNVTALTGKERKAK